MAVKPKRNYILHLLEPEALQEDTTSAAKIDSPPAEQSPLVSVIIPMFNAAKFIEQTLESLLYQTMTNFEVVVVDDCSTDNSVEVVENYRERFGGRLRIFNLSKNSGAPGLPRNFGIKAARGKYIAFLDSDDLYTRTALEELSTLAEKFQADVVHTDNWFILWNGKRKFADDPEFTNAAQLFNPESYTVRQPGENVTVVDAPTWDSNDIADRVRRWINWDYNWATWITFCRRDFLIDNEITFPSLKVTSDMFVTFGCLCLAKKFLRVPNKTYIVRPQMGSVSRDNNKELDNPTYFHKRVSSLREGFAAFENFMDKLPFFSKHPDYRHGVLKFFFERSMDYAKYFKRLYSENPLHVLNELVKREFSADAALTAQLFDTVNLQRLRIRELEAQLSDAAKDTWCNTLSENQSYATSPPLTKDSPPVSVIVSMFNAAKFIKQTLDSLLYQTMTNFEVVVVDDGSTDNSVAVVESYRERFGGRLQIIKLPQNTDMPGLVRNEGIRVAHGKYIAFLDSGDLFTKTALEELTTIAEKNQTDVVHTNGLFTLWGGKGRSNDDLASANFNVLTNPKNFTVIYSRKNKLTAPILETDDVAKRVNKWLNPPAPGFWTTWLNFYRREFLIANKIAFSAMVVCEDMPFAFETLCLAKKYLIVPNVTYIRIKRLGPAKDDKFFHSRVSTLNCGFSEFERIMARVPALENHPDYRYAMLDWFVNKLLPVTKKFYKRVPEFKLNDMVKQELQPDDRAFAACIFNKANRHLLQIDELENRIKSLTAQLKQ